jgi:hypothetical protein
VSHHPLIDRLAVYRGKPIAHCIDAIETLAHVRAFSVNVIDPAFNTGSIDNDATRLNVRTDADGNVTSFTIG